MCKKIFTVAKLNLKNIRVAYFVTGLIIAALTIQDLVYFIIANATGSGANQLNPSTSMYSWLLIMLAAIFIPAKNFRRTVNLGGKRDDFFWGSLMTYAILAGAISIFNTAWYYIIEQFLYSTGYYAGITAFFENPSILDNHYVTVNLIELFGWSSRGIFFALIQQFAFLFMLGVIVHTLTAMQDKWYGWITDIVIAGIISVFVPIAPLRSALVWFFYMIIFSNAFVQIASCLILATAVYALNKIIFARKII